jgi:hypothetical protein
MSTARTAVSDSSPTTSQTSAVVVTVPMVTHRSDEEAWKERGGNEGVGG